MANKIKIFIDDEEYDVIKKEEKVKIKLKDLQAGDCFKLNETEEFIVLAKCKDYVYAIRKTPICKMPFGKNDNFAESDVMKKLEEYRKELENVVGADGLNEFTIDLSSLDGSKDYGFVTVKVGILDIDAMRLYAEILNTYKAESYWWLATSWGKLQGEDRGHIVCVSPDGEIVHTYNESEVGVRPTCIFSDEILASFRKDPLG